MLLYGKIVVMNIDNAAEVVRFLLDRLKKLESAELLLDEIEGLHPEAQKAAVLIPFFYDQEGRLSLLFIRRASTLRAHSGEIAFAGGRVDASDSSVVMTALREAQEEIGLDQGRVEVLGLLSAVFTVVSNYVIAPVVAFLPEGTGELLLQESEVTEVIIIPLRELMNPAIAYSEEWVRGGVKRTVYFYQYGPYTIWGATGRMLHALISLLVQ